MAKLYWRVNINGKWLWRSATDENTVIVAPTVNAIIMIERAIAFSPTHSEIDKLQQLSQEEE